MNFRHIIVFLFASFCTTASINAQDVIVKKDSTRIESKVTEVSSVEVKYKKFTNPNGPIYSVKATEVAYVMYENGSVDHFVTKKDDRSGNGNGNGNSPRGRGNDLPEPYKPQPLKYNNMVMMNSFDLMFGVITVGYERGVSGDFMSLRIPVSVGAAALGGNVPVNGGYYGSSLEYYYNKYKIFSTGAELLIYPRGQKMLSYYAGPVFEIGSFYYWKYVSYQNYQRSTDVFYSLGLKNGMLIQPVDRLNIALDIAVGMVHASAGNDYPPMARLTIGMGWRF